MNQKELIWIGFPYSDLSERKIRPALIVSNNKYNTKSQDIIVCAVTSNPKNTEYSIDLKEKNLESGKLSIPSKIKADKIMQINKKLAIKPFAKIENKKFKEVTKQIQKLISEN